MAAHVTPIGRHDTHIGGSVTATTGSIARLIA